MGAANPSPGAAGAGPSLALATVAKCADGGISRNSPSAPPSTPVVASSAGVAPGPAHKVGTASSLTSPPPSQPREKHNAPARKTIRAQASAPNAPYRLG